MVEKIQRCGREGGHVLNMRARVSCHIERMAQPQILALHQSWEAFHKSIFGFSMNYQTKIVQYSDSIERVTQDINIGVGSKSRMHMTYRTYIHLMHPSPILFCRSRNLLI